MDFYKKSAEIFARDSSEIYAVLKRTTSLAIAAHQDDVEIMAFKGVLEARNRPDEYFTALICTDGAGSAREKKFKKTDAQELKNIRKIEQKNAAEKGNYNALIMLDHKSVEIKDKNNQNLFSDFEKIFAVINPKTVYTHNLADAHDTHVAVAVKTIKFLKSLPDNKKPLKVYGCEVWRSLDWLPMEDKTVFDVGGNDNFLKELLGCFESQNTVKNYIKGTAGRFNSNAVFSNTEINSDCLSFALDLTPLIYQNTDISDYICSYIEKFKKEVTGKIKKFF